MALAVGRRTRDKNVYIKAIEDGDYMMMKGHVVVYYGTSWENGALLLEATPAAASSGPRNETNCWNNEDVLDGLP